jgi:acyl carrier protein
MENRLLTIINTVLENRSKEKINSITNQMHLRNDLGFDSLDLAELTVRIEAEFDIDVFEDGMIQTIGEIIEKLMK